MALSEYLDSMDFTTLRKLILDMAPEDVDKSEGSFMYDAVTPIALFVSEMLGQMKLVLEQSFIGTATGTNLDILAATMPRLYRRGAIAEKLILSLYPESEDPSVIYNYILNNQQNMQFSNASGEIFKLDTDQDEWIWDDSTNLYVRVYKTISGRGSSVKGQTMEPSPAIQGLSSCQVNEISSGGGDAEDDDHFRVRIWASMSSPFLGSVSDYQRKIFSEFPLSPNGFNVENCFIIPRGSRSGYICVIPAKRASDGGVEHCTLGELNSLQEYLDKRIDKIGGYGFGVAPIGHVVKVRDFAEFKLHQKVTIIVASGKMSEVNTESARSKVISSTNVYLRSIIDEVIPSATNYMANAKRYVNFFIYYYVNAHEYAVLSTLRNAFGQNVIKTISIERIKTVQSFLLNNIRVESSPFRWQLIKRDTTDFVNVNDLVTSLDNYKLYSDNYDLNENSYLDLQGNSVIFVSRTGMQAGTATNVVMRGYTCVAQEDLVIMSGDSKGTLPVLGNLEIEIKEEE